MNLKDTKIKVYKIIKYSFGVIVSLNLLSLLNMLRFVLGSKKFWKLCKLIINSKTDIRVNKSNISMKFINYIEKSLKLIEKRIINKSINCLNRSLVILICGKIVGVNLDFNLSLISLSKSNIVTHAFVSGNINKTYNFMGANKGRTLLIIEGNKYE